MRYKIALIFLFIVIISCEASRRVKKGNNPTSKYLSGYFIFFRDTIINKDEDRIIDERSSIEFYVRNNRALDNLDALNVLIEKKDLDLTSSILSGSIQINNGIKSNIDSMMSGKYNYLDYIDYFPFNYNDIPADTMNTKFRFVSIFRGQIEMYGPVKTVEPFTYNEVMDGYLYMKNSNNNLEYLYSIVLSGSKFIGFLNDTEKKMLKHNDSINR